MAHPDHHPDHTGHHHHGGLPAAHAADTAFIVGIVLNAGYVIFQGIIGFNTHSMALLSDAGHNLSDVASLGLSLLAYRLARKKAAAAYTYGYKKGTIISALMNAVILLVTVGMLAFESFHHLVKPVPVAGGTVAWVSGLGILVNAGSAMLFFRKKDHDLNMRSAYLHLLSDALVSLGVVIGGLAIKYTSWYWLDGAISLLILFTIIWATWSLMMSSLRLSLDAVPETINLPEIEAQIRAFSGVVSMHHTHIWAMSTTENALTTHLVLGAELTFESKLKVVGDIKHMLLHRNITHATIEIESPEVVCPDPGCSQ
jgi:cobalt-zinc-cadmium efflux system protein